MFRHGTDSFRKWSGMSQECTHLRDGDLRPRRLQPKHNIDRGIACQLPQPGGRLHISLHLSCRARSCGHLLELHHRAVGAGPRSAARRPRVPHRRVPEPAIQGLLRSCRHCDLSLRHAGPISGRRGAELPSHCIVDHDARGVLTMFTRRQGTQRGQAVVIMAGGIVALTILGAMVFDAGLAMTDRRNLQAYADSAALAGSRSYGPGGNRAHWVAMQYLGSQLSFSLPAGSCAGANNCPAGTYTIAVYTTPLTATGRANCIVNYPTGQDAVISHQPPSVVPR